MRRAALVLAVAVLAALPSAPRARAQATDRLAAVQGLLDQRVDALRRGDRDAWLATVDPQAPQQFKAAQARSFDGLRSIPLASFALQARTQDTGDLAVGLGATARRGGDDVFLPETRERYRIEGFDDRDAVDSLWLTYVHRGGRWYVAADDDLVPLGLETQRNLWDLGPVRVHPTAHFLVLSHPEQASRADALAAIAEEAIATLNTRWDRPWLGRIPLVLPGSVNELATMLQTTFDLGNFVAFVSYGAVRDDGYEPTAPRVYIQDRNLSSYARSFQVKTLVHELVHAATVPLAGPLEPAWANEGLAEWVANGEPSDRRPPSSTQALPEDHQFNTGGSPSILRAYDAATSAMSYLSAQRGTRAPTDLYTAIGAARVAPGNVDHQVDVALRRVVGIGLPEFQRNWLGGR